MTHLQAYHDKAIEIHDLLENNEPNISSSIQRYNANDARLQRARELGLSLYNEPLAFENGNVMVTVYEGVPFFGLNEDQKSDKQLLAEEAISLSFGFIPWIGPLGTVGAIAKELQWEEYFEAFPESILQKGDVVVYYSPAGHGGYGSYYASRNGDLLYEDHRDSGGKTILGKNYMKYAAQFKADTTAEALLNIALGEFLSFKAGKAFKPTKKILD